MSGIQTSMNAPLRASTNGHDNPRGPVAPPARIALDIPDLNVSNTISGSPNDSVELRDMVRVAAAYVDRGMVDDAEEMLREVLSAGYTRQDALELGQRIRSLRGESATAPVVASGIPVMLLDEFTQPLPGIDSQSVVVRRAVEDAEKDVAAGRLQSAHDLTLVALSHAPTYLPVYVRLAELRMALGDEESAARLVETLTQALDAHDEDWLTLSIRAILNPDDTDTLLRLASALIEHRGLIQLEPWVPEAIERAIDDRAEIALDLSREYLRLRSNDRIAQRLYIRSVVAAGNLDEATTVLNRDVDADSPADLVFLRSAVAYAGGKAAWFEWLERAVARVLSHPDEYAVMPRAVEATQSILPAAQFGLAAGVIRLAGGDPAGALEALAPWDGPPRRDTSDTQQMLVAACTRAYAQRARSPVESIEALAQAVAQAVVIDVRPFAESCALFTRPISAEALMDELVGVVRETGEHERAIMQLEALRDRLPEHLEIRSGLADLQVAAGRVAEGLRELRYVAEKHERAGNIERMVEAMRHMSAAVPANAEMKARLIEAYVNRGFPDEAVRELGLVGDIYLKRGKPAEAAAAFSRGAEIAATTGDHQRAVDLFDRAVATVPDDVSIRHSAVAVYIMTGAIQKATDQLWEVVRIALETDDPDEAVASLHQIIGLAPAEAAAYHKLGEILTALGEYAQAERVYRRLSSFTPDDPVLAAKQSALAALASGR